MLGLLVPGVHMGAGQAAVVSGDELPFKTIQGAGR